MQIIPLIHENFSLSVKFQRKNAVSAEMIYSVSDKNPDFQYLSR